MSVAMSFSVSSGFRLKRGLGDFWSQAHLLNHSIKDMIMRVTNLLLTDFQIHMAVTEMVTDAGQLKGVFAKNSGDCFFGCLYPDNKTIIGYEAVATTQNATTL